MKGKSTVKNAFQETTFDVRKYVMVFALIGIWLLFGFLSDGAFLFPRNMSNLFRQTVFTSLLAFGMLNVIVIGQIDISVGSLAGLSGGVLAILNVWKHVPPQVAIAITLALGLALGLWNGWWVAYRNVPAFIVTLAGMLVFRGILVGLTDGITIGPLDPIFSVLGQGFINPTIGWILAIIGIVVFIFLQYNGWKRRTALGMAPENIILRIIIFSVLIVGFVFWVNAYNGIPNPVALMVVFFIVFNYVTTNTVFGRRLFAIGGNQSASRLAGINIKRQTLIVFAINGLMAAIAGIVLSSRLNSASVIAGDSAEFDAIAACVVGGTSLMGGIGSTFGAIVGAIVIASLDNGMGLLDVPSFWQTIVKGLVLLLAVWFDMSRKKEGLE
jgi:D-xylose transport system permease protein